jgi:hypothetical protein
MKQLRNSSYFDVATLSLLKMTLYLSGDCFTGSCAVACWSKQKVATITVQI